jgi:hypothetical protein
MSVIAPNSYTKLRLSLSTTENYKSDYYQVEDFGFIVMTTDEQHGTVVYPTANDISPPGWFALTVWPVAMADINGDGLDDLIIRPMMYPHTVARNTEIQPLILTQGNGSFASDPLGYIAASNFPSKYHLNQIGVGDFNGDGFDDLAFGSEGEHRFDNGIVTTHETPLVVFGGLTNDLQWSDSPGDVSAFDYGASHILAVGDFNGDGFDDWVSGWYAFYSDGKENFEAHRLTGIGNNAAISVDVNEDGYSDLIFSNMPSAGDVTQNGGDLKIMFGSAEGLKDGVDTADVFRSKTHNDNIATSSIAHGDFNGDGHVDLILAEHGWISNAGDSSDYYSKSFFRFFAGDSAGGFVEDTSVIIDPHSKERRGGANLISMDINGDGWDDFVVIGGESGGTSWFSMELGDSTSVFLNDRGTLRLLDSSDLAFVQPYQFQGFEQTKPWQLEGVPRSFPVDIGNDGLVDFVSFVETPLTSLPQVEQRYTYAYVSKAIKPLGRPDGDEVLVGNESDNRIFGFNGNDVITGMGGDDYVDGGTGFNTAIIRARKDQVERFDFTSDGKGFVIESSDGKDTFVNIQRIQFNDALLEPYALRSLFAPTSSFSVNRDGNSSTAQPSFYTGDPSLDLHYQLIDTTPNAVVIGSALNDFIALQGGGNKATDGGLGDDVIDGGVGSTFISGGGGSNTFFLDGRADGVSWSTITDFTVDSDKATIWGWKPGVSQAVLMQELGGAEGYQGLTLHFENLLPSDAGSGDTNSNWNSITFSGKSASDFGFDSLETLNAQILAGTNPNFLTGQTVDDYGTHGYLFIS